MEHLGLYDKLVGFFASEWPNELGDPERTTLVELELLPEDRQLRLSIAENLKMILRTRQGSVAHLPDFGLPDILKSYLDAGRSVDPLIENIRSTIIKYEPRITDVRIEKSFDEKNLRLGLRVSAMIRSLNQREVLHADFSSSGWTRVVFERDIK